LYLELTQQVPAVEDMEAFFEEDGFMSSKIVDHEGDPWIDLAHPASKERKWVGLTGAAPVTAPDLLVKALVLNQDPTFWQNPGYSPQQTLSMMTADALGRRVDERLLTITEQLIAATLLPIEAYPEGSLRRDFRTALLAERLTDRFEKSQILEWYLNSVDYGNFIYGVDSASLAYFGKHANGLSLGELAVLAAIPGQPDQVLASPISIRQAQREVLETLVERGEITARQAREARGQPLQMDGVDRFPDSPAAELVLERAADYYGPSIHARGGLTLVSSIEADLQQQATCLLRTQQARLAGDENRDGAPAEVGSLCLTSGLMPPLRPGEFDLDQKMDLGAVVVMDPQSGQLRAYAASSLAGDPDAALEAHPAGELIHPFIYLTAFSRGFSPGSMVLDLPPRTEVEVMDAETLAGYQGPVRMRQALQSGLEGAASRTVEIAGIESVERTLREFNLYPDDRPVSEGSLVSGAISIRPLALAQGYAALANKGVLVGVGNGALQPRVLLKVEDRFGRPHDPASQASRAVLSEPLAYLVTDTLRGTLSANNHARSASSLGLDQPSAWMVSSETDGHGVWSVGYTPSSTVLVWLGSEPEVGDLSLSSADTTLPAAAALLRYSTRDMIASGWAQPLGISEVEVCDPSGLLPTSYCPEVVTEIFLQGTEPTSFDNLYQPFRLNRETGNLATLATPLEFVEEQVYLVPPPEAAAWAEAVGLPQPPNEYDPLPAQTQADEDVNIAVPEPYQVIRGQVVIRGDAHPEELDFYRLQAGAGLNPSRWIQIGEDQDQRVWGGQLGRWDTEALSGFYTLQLVVVLEDGEIRTASLPVTIDNLAPQVTILQPGQDQAFLGSETVQIEVSIKENIELAEVRISLDGRVIARLQQSPFEFQLEDLSAGVHEISVVATDAAGNESPAEALEIRILP
ncbi:MAG: penicillin-binding protein, partial [Anaerolineales bacterium]